MSVMQQDSHFQTLLHKGKCTPNLVTSQDGFVTMPHINKLSRKPGSRKRVISQRTLSFERSKHSVCNLDLEDLE